MRYLSLTERQKKEMLDAIGIKELNELYPNEVLQKITEMPLLSPHKPEHEVLIEMQEMAKINKSAANGNFFLGAGCYNHYVPAAVKAITQRSEFLTSYTPYQPEMSQGTLKYMYDFQTLITEITAADIANASMYEGATAMVEAVNMARNLTSRQGVYLHGAIHPHYVETLNTYIDSSHITCEPTDDDACFVFQVPDFLGNIHDMNAKIIDAKTKGKIVIAVITEIIALGILPPPDVDIICGNAGSLGADMNFGGPGLGFLACKKKFLRKMPGRICGKTTDKEGKTAFTLTVNTREQHIRREKASSNICTNQSLLALAFTIHAALLGKTGIKKLALLNHANACIFADMLSAINGVTVLNTHFFNEFTISIADKNTTEIVKQMSQQNIIAGHPVSENKLIVTCTELTSHKDMQNYIKNLQKLL